MAATSLNRPRSPTPKPTRASHNPTTHIHHFPGRGFRPLNRIPHYLLEVPEGPGSTSVGNRPRRIGIGCPHTPRPCAHRPRIVGYTPARPTETDGRAVGCNGAYQLPLADLPITILPYRTHRACRRCCHRHERSSRSNQRYPTHHRPERNRNCHTANVTRVPMYFTADRTRTGIANCPGL